MQPQDHPLHTCPILPEKYKVYTTHEPSHFNALNKQWTDEAYEALLKEKVATAGEELLSALELIKQYPKSVTFYGSAQLPEDNEYYKKAQRLAARTCELGYAVVSGGGPGIMEAANRGGYETCGYSIGFNIELPSEQVVNPYVTHGKNFQYFFTRKTALHFSSEVFLSFPGGFGTFDETFELITLMQTGKSPRVPVILVGTDFWMPFVEVISKVMLDTFKTISAHDMDLFQVVDDEDAIMDIIKHAPMRNAYKEMRAEKESHAHRV